MIQSNSDLDLETIQFDENKKDSNSYKFKFNISYIQFKIQGSYN